MMMSTLSWNKIFHFRVGLYIFVIVMYIVKSSQNLYPPKLTIESKWNLESLIFRNNSTQMKNGDNRVDSPFFYRKFVEALKLFSVYFKRIVTEDRKNGPLIGMQSTTLGDFHKLQTLRFAYFFTRFPSLRILSLLYFRLLFLSLLSIGNDNTKKPSLPNFLEHALHRTGGCTQAKSCENLCHSQ